MRKLLPVFLFVLTAVTAYTQTPQAIKYQAVARDEAGNVLANSDVAFRIAVVENNENGPGVYVETHNVTSNEFGLISMEVGRGTPVTGTMQGVDWANARHFLRVEMDATGGTSFELMGVSELLTVPYAFHARTAENVDDADADTTNELITRLELIGAGLEIEEGGQVRTVNLASLINDADADPNNELITQVNFRNDSIVITEGGVERGVEIQGLFSGDYGDLSGLPNFQDSINLYGFDGDYNNLSNVPNFQDSINLYGFDGDYNNLVNRPDIADSINILGFDGDYNSLSNKPDFQDSINLYGFDGNYGSLSGVPNFQDTVNAYGFDGDYNNLNNVPNFADTVNAYGFDGDYNNLVNRPDIADSINTLGFDGNYGSLTGVPNFQDTVNTYGFDGDYNNLNNVPNFADTVNTYGTISSATFNNDSLFITEAGTTFDVDLSSLSGVPQDLSLTDDTLRITDNASATPILLSDYRSKWNETPGGDLFTNRKIGFGVSNPLYRLHLHDTLTGSDTALVKLSSYNNSTSNPNEKATLLVENNGVSNRNHNGIFIKAIGSGSARNAGLRLISDNATRNYGGILRTGMDNISGTSAIDNIGYLIDAGNATTFNIGVESNIRDATGAFNVAQWGVVRDNSVPSAISFSVGGYMQVTAANDAINRGVWAIARNAANENYGIYATVDNSTNGTNYAVYGDASGATNAFAGFFDGDVEITGDLNVTGNIAKGGGTFRIDHPMDPQNKYLVHSFVESPDMMNVYNGNITTDGNGFATVELPDYFSEINKDFRYQLTVVGTFAQAIVKEKIAGNRFVIQTNQPNVEVSWQVTGIRNDPYARENRIEPEQEKPQGKKGKYLHPHVYGVDKQTDRSKFKDLPSVR